jgi:hypothetical protein
MTENTQNKQTITTSIPPESVYFFTFHKCASTLFSSYILKNIDGLKNIDYASAIYSGEIGPNQVLEFNERGFIYGPIRISADADSPVSKMLVKPTTNHDFIRDKVALFFLRDPRDILVSSYYSFGFTHGFSIVDEIRDKQEQIRRETRDKTLDNYVLQSANKQIIFFQTLYDLSRVCDRSTIIKYEDMISNFDIFANQLVKYVSIKDEIIEGIYEKSRPQETEDLTSHRRSGRIQNFRQKLKQETIQALNRQLAHTLELFGYEI